MTEQNYDGNLFLLPNGRHEAGVVTTNGILKANGLLVMGAGIAKYCRDTHAGIDRILGDRVSQDGNHAFLAGWFHDRNREAGGLRPEVGVMSMPTKHNWRDQSNISLIRTSCREMMAIADRNSLSRIYLPAPGCSNGGLDYVRDVRPILQAELDGRFVVCLPSGIWRTIPENER